MPNSIVMSSTLKHFILFLECHSFLILLFLTGQVYSISSVGFYFSTDLYLWGAPEPGLQIFFFTYALASLLIIFKWFPPYSQVQNSQPLLRRLCLETRLLLIFSLEGIIAYHTPSIISFKAVPPKCHTFFCLSVPTHWLSYTWNALSCLSLHM